MMERSLSSKIHLAHDTVHVKNKMITPPECAKDNPGIFKRREKDENGEIQLSEKAPPPASFLCNHRLLRAPRDIASL
jgi:hypothetical protein